MYYMGACAFVPDDHEWNVDRVLASPGPLLSSSSSSSYHLLLLRNRLIVVVAAVVVLPSTPDPTRSLPIPPRTPSTRPSTSLDTFLTRFIVEPRVHDVRLWITLTPLRDWSVRRRILFADSFAVRYREAPIGLIQRTPYVKPSRERYFFLHELRI